MPDLTPAYFGPTPNADQRAKIQQQTALQGRQLTLWWLDRLAATSKPATEKLTWLWHGLFATSSGLRNEWSDPASYVLVSDTLAGRQAQLPPGLVRLERQLAEPPEVVEIWFPAPAKCTNASRSSHPGEMDGLK